MAALPVFVTEFIRFRSFSGLSPLRSRRGLTRHLLDYAELGQQGAGEDEVGEDASISGKLATPSAGRVRKLVKVIHGVLCILICLS